MRELLSCSTCARRSRSDPFRAVILAAVVVSLALLRAAAGFAAPTVTESANAINVDNGLVSFAVGKTNGLMTGLTLGTQSLMSEGGTRGYFSANVGDIGVSGSTYWQMGSSGTTSSYTLGADFVDVVLHYPASSSMPMDVTQHYVLRDGESGFHVYADVHHAAAMADKRIEEMRFVLRADPSLFDHHYVAEDRQSIMPTPADLVNKIATLQDATDLLQPGTAYEAETGKNVYTKYDWAAEYDELGVYGYYGHDYGAWIVQPNRETLLGGPTKQELTVHQTTTTPVLLGMLVGQHFSTPGSVETVGDYDRALGPLYVHLNSEGNGSQLAADAATYFDPDYHRAFYDSLGAPGWIETPDRGQVLGTLHVAGLDAVAGAKIVLADNRTEFQFSKQGYQYWTTVAADGTFELPNVRPGSYRLTAYGNDAAGEMHLDDLQVEGGAALDLGVVDWQVADHGAYLWQIGVFDRSGEEFRHGADNDYRQYGMWDKYAGDFPNDVNFVIGQSEEAQDWNFAHWERAPDGHSPEWDVQFDVGTVPAGRVMTLTIAVAGQQDANLRVKLNGATVKSNWDIPNSGSVLSRSGAQGPYSFIEIPINSSMLVPGANTLTLSHASPGSSVNQGIVYDALRLEIDALLGDFNADDLVDGADFLAWQRTQLPGTVSQQDFAYWSANFGATSDGTLAAGVPEPTSLVLAAIFVVTPFARFR
ncbi:MAG: hypothetical protein KDA44_17730 [Planctomycetales bacterium]|nr:hypothetical protein [Planctomycetales bacterium]